MRSAKKRSNQTRARILTAARVRFSRYNYENVSIRDVAADAGVDSALISRYFGGKQKLYVKAIKGAFRIEGYLIDDLDQLGAHLVSLVLHARDQPVANDIDPLKVLLHAAGSPATANVVSRIFHAEFVLPVARVLPGRDPKLRAALIGSILIGLGTLHHALGSATITAAEKRKVTAIVGAAVQLCITPK